MKTHSLFHNSIFATSLSLMAKILGFLGTLLAARAFGAVVATDIALFMFSIITLVASFFQAYNASVLVPEAIRLASQHGPKAIRDLFSLFATRVVVILMPLTLFLCWQNQAVFLALSRFSLEDIHLHQTSILISIPLLPLMYLNDLMIHMVQIRGNFLITGLSQCLPGLCQILVVGFGAVYLGPKGISLGFLVAAILQFMWLYQNLYKENLHLTWQWRSQSELSLIKKLWWPMTLLQLLTCLQAYVVDYFITGLGAGAMTAYLYGRKVHELFPNLLIYPLVAALYPRLCQLAQKESRELFLGRVVDMHTLLVAITTPVAILIMVHAKDLCEFLFQRGAFQSEAALLSSLTLAILSFGLVITAANSLLYHSLYALQDSKVYSLLVLRTLLSLILSIAIFFSLDRDLTLPLLCTTTVGLHVILSLAWNQYLRSSLLGIQSISSSLWNFFTCLLVSSICVFLPLSLPAHFLVQCILSTCIYGGWHYFTRSREFTLLMEQWTKRKEPSDQDSTDTSAER